MVKKINDLLAGIRATGVGQDSSLQKLIRMVQEAEDKKAPMARIADTAASWLVPAALGIAIVAWLVTGDIVRAVTVLVVFCPCALVLATPTAIMAAIGQATKHGVIIKSGEALVLTAAQGQCIGAVALADALRPEAADMVARLGAMGTAAVLLTGDNALAAGHFAEQVGISTVHAELLPEEKVQSIVSMQADGHCVCMIGDGVNDAPALKTADVGVAMGSMGSDIAVEAADIALMSDGLSRIPYLKRLSAATVRTIKGSITLSMCINFVAVTLSVLGVLNPTTGALVHNAGSCFVVLLAALLYDRKFD